MFNLIKEVSMFTIHNLSYIHPNKNLLFSTINLTLNSGEKIALVGNNGVGKSTLLKIISGNLSTSEGTIKIDTVPYYIPQLFGQFDNLTIAEVLKCDQKLKALHQILNGTISEDNFNLLNDDWTIEERCKEALVHWKLENLDLFQKLETLSGGQKIKVFLAGILVNQPELILLDEPSNHLDHESRQLLYNFIKDVKQTLIVVSHDRKLLNLLDKITELSPNGIAVYGGNYDFYSEQKQLKNKALVQDIHNNQKALKKAKDKEQETLERQQKADNRGKGKQEKSGVARIMMNTLRNNAENSTAKLKSVHAEKTESIKQKLQELRSSQSVTDQMKFDFDDSHLHSGKILFKGEHLNFSYQNGTNLWSENIYLEVLSGERIAIKGNNGSGKTTLINIILGNLTPTGTVFRAENKSVYIDQDYSLIDNKRTIYDQVQEFNIFGLQEHEVKTRLNRFLFTKDTWDKSCAFLSGGERMRLTLCCLNIQNQSPDIIILDEPTNNLDTQNIEILTNAINNYSGSLIVISHDETFLDDINIGRVIKL